MAHQSRQFAFLAGVQRGLQWCVKHAIVLFTGVLGVVAVLQYWAFIRSERAFVAPTSTDFAIKETVGVKLLPMYLELHNSGRSTATIDELSVGITHELGPIPVYAEAPKFAFPPVVAGGTTKQELKFATEWGEATANGVKTGSMPFHIYGRIRYHDDIGWSERETGFCFVHTPESTVAPFQTCPERAFTYSH
jgi:hypothetical protein